MGLSMVMVMVVVVVVVPRDSTLRYRGIDATRPRSCQQSSGTAPTTRVETWWM